MKASEMTNDELANWIAIITGSADVGLPTRYREYLREAAARLRNVTVRTDNSNVITELQRRLKVAEDALVVCMDGMCGECRRQHLGETCVNGCYEMSMARNALAVIREEKI